MRVALVGLAAGRRFQQMAAVVNPGKEAYCRRYGYDFIHFDEPLDRTRPLPWSKIPAVLQVLPAYDWVLWHDTDTVLWQPHSLREFTAQCGDAFCLLQNDGLGLNSGIFLIRNTPRAHQFLAAAWRRTDLIHAAVWEQAAIAQLAHAPEWRSAVRCYEVSELSPGLQKCFFAPHDQHWDRLFLHLAGFHQHRLQRLANLVALAALEDDDRLLRAADLGAFLNRRRLLGRGVLVSVADAWRAEAILGKWEGRRLDVIDPWRAPTGDDPRLRLHNVMSSRVRGTIADGSLDFVCLDGAHWRRGYLAEVVAWLPKLRPGGVVAGGCGNRQRGAEASGDEASGDHASGDNASGRDAPWSPSSIPRELWRWCAARNIRIGVTTDWPTPTWFMPEITPTNW